MTEAEVAAPSRTSGRELVRALRPRQWPKNLLVGAAPMAGGAFGRPVVLAMSFVAFAVFTAAAAGGYLLNDVCDVEADRMHPEKRLRPVAAGTLPITVAIRCGVGLIVLALAAAALTDDELFPLVAMYSLLTFAYGYGLKRMAGLELLVLASGFVLRPLAGAAATDVRPSVWFLAVCCLAAVALATGKRLVELVRLGPRATTHRVALGHYSTAVLGRAQVAAVAGLSVAYLGWALSRHPGPVRILSLLSLAPLVATFARVVRVNRRGEGGAPEELLLGDRPLQVAVAAWFLLFAGGLLYG